MNSSLVFPPWFLKGFYRLHSACIRQSAQAANGEDEHVCTRYQLFVYSIAKGTP
jgi:hypothetical protein